MTPEERARVVVSAFTGDEYWIDTEAAIASVAAAIREAVTDERERCAEIARLTADAYPPDVFVLPAGQGARLAAECIYDSIRAPGEEPHE